MADDSYTLADKFLVFVAATLAWSHDAVGLTITNFLAIPIMEEFNVGKEAIGFIFSAQYIATVFGAVVFGELADRFGRRRALFYSILWDSLITAASALAPNFITLAILRIISGMGVSWGIAFAILSEVYSPRLRGLFGGLIHTTFIIGYILSAATVSLLYPLYGWRVCYLIALYPLPIIIVLALFMPESRVWIKYKELEDAGEIEISKMRIGELFRGKLFRWTLICALLFWGSEFAYHALVDWAPTMLVELFLFTVDEASNLVLLISGLVLLFLPFIGFTSDLIGRKIAFIASASIGLIGTVALGYYTILVFNRDAAIISLFVIPLGFGAHALYGVWSSEIFPTRVRATATSFIFSIARGLSLGGFIVGVTSKTLGLISAMVTFGLIGFILMVILPWFLPETRGKIIDIEAEAIEKH